MCLANTTIQPSSSGQPSSLGQASFDYASAPSAGAFYAAIAEYQGSHLCKTAPSDGVLLVWLLRILLSAAKWAATRPALPLAFSMAMRCTLCVLIPILRCFAAYTNHSKLGISQHEHASGTTYIQYHADISNSEWAALWAPSLAKLYSPWRPKYQH